MTRDEFDAFVLSLPETEAGTSWGKPSFKTCGKFLTRVRAEDDSAVLYVDTLERRDMLIEAEPQTFHITDHYLGYPIVLARLSHVDSDWLRATLTQRWKRIAPAKVVKAHPAL